MSWHHTLKAGIRLITKCPREGRRYNGAQILELSSSPFLMGLKEKRVWYGREIKSGRDGLRVSNIAR
jgi:hypothetical protein